jgi:hypothetical protein
MGAQRSGSPSIPALLDSYSRGDFSGAVRTAASWPDLVSWRKAFPPAARIWIDSVPEQRDPVSLVGAPPPSCRAELEEGGGAETLDLSEADFLNPATSTGLGELYATKISVICDPAGTTQ